PGGSSCGDETAGSAIAAEEGCGVRLLSGAAMEGAGTSTVRRGTSQNASARPATPSTNIIHNPARPLVRPPGWPGWLVGFAPPRLRFLPVIAHHSRPKARSFQLPWLLRSRVWRHIALVPIEIPEFLQT